VSTLIAKDLHQAGVGSSAIGFRVVAGDNVHAVGDCLADRLRQRPHKNLRRQHRLAAAGLPKNQHPPVLVDEIQVDLYLNHRG